MKRLRILFVLLLIIFPGIVLADTGPKPTINITLKNMTDSNYLIDLVSNFENRPDDIEKIVDNYIDYQDRPIYKYHDGTWYATAIRDWLLFGSILGNSEYKHTFTYFGVPDEFMVIIEMPDGTLKVTDKIIKTSFNFDIEIDVNDMKVTNMVGQETNYWKCLGILLLTIVIETLLALLFKTKKYHIIALTNLATNVCLQLLMFNFNLSLFQFVLAEIAIVGIEAAVYLITIKLNKTKIAIYTILANLITALLTFFI